MTNDELTRELFQIIDKLINLLTLQSGAEFVMEEQPPTGGEAEAQCDDDMVAGYALTNTWHLEDEIVRDPDLPDIGDPEE